MRLFQIFSLAVAVLYLPGCGLYVPNMQEFYEPPEHQKITENTVINHIKCEIHKGVDDALDKYKGAGIRSGFKVDWFKDWNATVTLKLSVDEKGSIGPGVTWTRALSNATTFALGAGFDFSSQATRMETISFSYSLTTLRNAGRITNPCEEAGATLLLGDLKIGEFIDKKVFLSTVPGTIVGPYSAFEYQVSFEVASGGSVTPTWRLVEVTANPGAPFAGASRTRTHTVTVTFSAPNNVAAAEAARLHNAALIGQAVADAIKRNTR